MNNELDSWLAAMPKAELHLHIDGSLQAHRLLSLAAKNSVELPYSTIEEVEAAYDFENLQSFLDLYYLGASVLIDEDDFYHLMMDYLLKCKEQNVVHSEIMIEPQTYAPNGVEFGTMMAGFDRAIDQANEQWGQSTLLILSFLRHLSQDDALQMLESAKLFAHRFAAIGLASAEVGNPPEKFIELYAQARSQGYKAVVHAGEEGPPKFIWDSLDLLNADRIDHGVRCAEDQQLLNSLVENNTPLTVCPLSNIRLRVFDSMAQHNILDLLELGVCVTVNSDDPAYFGGYMNENFSALAKDLSMSKAQALRLSKNAFRASFLSDEQKQLFLQRLEAFSTNNMG
ncbi:MAG: adenosine deaminase [Cryomorphaceae bacterium]|jgi:adenosine deaminase